MRNVNGFICKQPLICFQYPPLRLLPFLSHYNPDKFYNTLSSELRERKKRLLRIPQGVLIKTQERSLDTYRWHSLSASHISVLWSYPTYTGHIHSPDPLLPSSFLQSGRENGLVPPSGIPCGLTALTIRAIKYNKKERRCSNFNPLLLCLLTSLWY